LIESRMASLHREAIRFERAERRKEMQSLHFSAIHYTGDSERDGEGIKGAIGEFTPSGPIESTLQPLPSGIRHAVIDPAGPTYYGIKSHSVVQFDVKTGAVSELTLDAELPRLNWPCGLAFDTKRRRLVLASFGGEGFMYSYEVDDKKWSLMTSLENVQLHCLTYSTEDDRLYALNHKHEKGVDTIFSYSPKGVLLKRVRLEKPIPVGRRSLHGCTQIVRTSNRVVIFTQPRPDLETAGEPVACRSYVIDPSTGKELWSDISLPHTEP